MADADIALATEIRREELLKDILPNLPPNKGGQGGVTKSAPTIGATTNTPSINIIDCPPSLGLLAINALTAADYLLIPVQVEYLGMEGLAELLQTIEKVRRKGLNRNLQILGVLPTRYDGRNNLHLEVLNTLLAQVPETLPTVIRQNIALAEAPSHGQTIFEYAPNSHGAEDYAALAGEVLKRLKNTKIQDDNRIKNDQKAKTRQKRR